MDVRVEYKRNKRSGAFRISDDTNWVRLPQVGETYMYENTEFIVQKIVWVTANQNRKSSYSRSIYVVVHLVAPEAYEEQVN